MTTRQLPTWLALGSLLLVAGLGLGWMMLGLAGDYTGRIFLPYADAEVEVLPSSDSEQTLAQVRALPDSAWQPWKKPAFATDKPDHSVWVRVTLRNPSSTTQHGVLTNADTHADRVRFFEAPFEANTQPLLSGEGTPVYQKAIWGRGVAFPVTLPPHSERTVYLWLQDHFGVWLEPAWWPQQAESYAAQSRNTLVEGAYFGILLALIFYNAVLWVRLRFPDTGRYLLYLTSFTAYMLLVRGGPAELGFALGSPDMETWSMVLLAMSGAFLASFARAFLELSTIAPRADYAARIVRNIMATLAGGSLLLSWTGHADVLVYVLLASAITHLVLFFVAIAAWRSGARQARYFILAFGLLLAGLAPTLPIWVVALPLDVLARTVMIGSALEMLLLAVATADRFALIQKEKLNVQNALLEETAQREAIQEAYSDELEVEVRERTTELASANADKDRMIAVLGHDLRSPLTGLTQTAEQLTASADPLRIQRFVADTARTGRQLLLMIEDLVLWAQLSAGSHQKGTYTVQSVVAPVVTLHRSLAEREGVELVLEIPPDLRISTDLVLAQTLVRNLVANAVKFARHRVTLEASPTPEGVRISVRDDGPGLPTDIASQLVAGGATAWVSISGLGLRLCREISQVIGTRFEVTSPAEGGTAISFTLPTPPVS